tara:strand:- start:292 stop:1791 length:1500 start_codon:yes stop_codon:yes gene_type:complete
MKMNKLFFIFLVSTLISCSTDSNQNPLNLEILPSGGNKILKTRVIDGYISGANIYIDMNWNLQQDINEPSAYEDTENQEYYFDTEDFSGINNWSIECSQARPRVAEVPVGAVDADRGTVESAYEMFYFPYFNQGNSGEQGEYRANVTPLTSLFMSYVSDTIGDEVINDVDGCNASANRIGTSVIERVAVVMQNLQNKFNIDPILFYSDFIASDNQQLQEYGQLIVNFLQLIYRASSLLENEYNIKMSTQLDDRLIETILLQEPFTSTTFAVISETSGEDLLDGYTKSYFYSFYEIQANQLGQLLNLSGDVIELTLENLKSNSRFTIREVMFSKNPVFGDTRVLLEYSQSDTNGSYRLIDFGDFIENNRLTRLQIYNELRQITQFYPGENNVRDIFNLRIENQDNTYFDIDLERIFLSRNSAEIEQIFNDVEAVKIKMSEFNENTYLLFDQDYQQIYNSNWSYLEMNLNSNIEMSCLEYDTNNRTVGNDAYALCLSVFEN